MRASALAGLLAEPERLRVVAALVLGAASFEEVAASTGLSLPEVGKAVRRLEAAGLVVADGGRYAVRTELFKQAARSERPAPEDLGPVDPADAAVLRAFIKDGRLIRFPVAPGKWLVVLRYLVSVFEPGVRYPEPEVNAVLTAFHDDYAQLRRLLVDHGLLTREGGRYWRTGGYLDVLGGG